MQDEDSVGSSIEDESSSDDSSSESEDEVQNFVFGQMLTLLNWM